MARRDDDHAFSIGPASAAPMPVEEVFVDPQPFPEPSAETPTAAEARPRLAPMNQAGASRRVDARYLVRWRAALVLGEGAGRQMVPLRTLDISLGGMAAYGAQGLCLRGKLSLLIALPPLTPKDNETVLEVEVRSVYAVLDTKLDGFRYGFSFIRFRGSDREKLQTRLEKNHIPART